jgi:hypothetical protein
MRLRHRFNKERIMREAALARQICCIERASPALSLRNCIGLARAIECLNPQH